MELELHRCKFVDDCLSEQWLSGLKLKVTRLEIINSNLRDILANAFNSDVFRGTLLHLKIDNSLYVAADPLVFQFFTRLSFNGLTSLSQLTITNIPTLSIRDRTFLQPFSESLTQLTISRIANPWTVAQALSATVFKKISFVDLQANHLSTLDSSSFAGIAESVQQLFLTNSKIKSIAVDTFTNFKSLNALYMQTNLLTELPAGVFDSLIEKPGTVITLGSNRWHCNCSLIATQKMILDNPEIFAGTSQCVTPEKLKNMDIIKVELCPEPEETTIPFTSQSEVIGGCGVDDGEGEDCPQTDEITAGS
jgi:Leucine rich repeat